jgi:hypothetical protein
VAPNRATELEMSPTPAGDAVFAARLLVADRIVARAALCPEPFKYLALPDPNFRIARMGDDRLRLRVKRPAKGLLLVADPDQRWSDNMLDLLPEDDQIITAPGIGDAVTVRRLGMETPVRYAIMR